MYTGAFILYTQTPAFCSCEAYIANTANMSVVGSLEPPTYSIACIPADGIGIEVIEAGVEVLKTLAEVSGTFKLEFEDYDWSSETYKKTGKYIPDGGLESLKKHNAILFGAVGAPGKSNQSSKESPQEPDA